MNRTIVVTGASAGVGRAVVRRLGARGERVGLLARASDHLDAAVKEVDALGGRAIALPADVADAGAVDAMAQRAENELGPIDVWVNCAMTSVFARFWDIEPDEYERVTDVTYHGYVNGTRSALARMRPRDNGLVVQVGSGLAYRGIPGQAAYCGAKHAIQGFTDSVRTELRSEHSNIRISTVHLPAINTPQFDWVLSRLPRRAQPVPPIFQPEVAAEVVVHATEYARREYWLAWSTVRTIVGAMVAPGILDRLLGRMGIDSQQTDEPRSGERPSNLWASVPGDWGARGSFDDRSLDRSVMAHLAMQRDRVLRATGADKVRDTLSDMAARALARLL